MPLASADRSPHRGPSRRDPASRSPPCVSRFSPRPSRRVPARSGRRCCCRGWPSSRSRPGRSSGSPRPGAPSASTSWSRHPNVVITAPFILGRLSAFALIGVGVGLAGQKLRRSERRSRRLVEGLPLVMYTEQDGLTYVSPQIESLIGYPVAAWLHEPDLWRRCAAPRRSRPCHRALRRRGRRARELRLRLPAGRPGRALRLGA